MTGLTSQIDERGVRTLTLDRPEVHNAFDDALIADLTSVLDAAADESGLRAVVLTGAGASFSAGADLEWMRRMAAAGERENAADALRLARLMRCLNFLPVPTIARINGHAFGGGVGLIACCDVTVAVDTAKFGTTEARLGLAPAVISPYVTRRVGAVWSRRLFTTGERFDASRAQTIGLVQQVVAEADLDASIEAILDDLLRSGPKAARACKALAQDMGGEDRKRQRSVDERTARLIARLRTSREGQEGIAAFLEKRRPDWSDH